MRAVHHHSSSSDSTREPAATGQQSLVPFSALTLLACIY